jgi:tetratricopeptide (TPR) repeat protein
MYSIPPDSSNFDVSILKRRRQNNALGAIFTLCCLLFASAAWSNQESPEPASNAPLVEADHLFSQGNAQQAIPLLLPLSLKQPVLPGVERMLGKAYYETRDLPLAIKHLREAMRQNPEDWEAMQLLAIANFGIGDVSQTASLLREVIPHLPEGRQDAERLLGVCYLRLQQIEQARGAFSEMFGLRPDSAMAYFMLGKMMVSQQMQDLAIPQLKMALEIDPRLAMTHFLLGEIYLTRDENSKALSEFQRELEVNPSVWLVYWRLGDAYMRLQRYEEAEQALKQSLWLNDAFTGGYLLLGQVELQKNESNLARGFLERAVKLDPQNPYGHYFLGRAYQKLGMLEQANHEFELQKTMREAKFQYDSASQQPSVDPANGKQ